MGVSYYLAEDRSVWALSFHRSVGFLIISAVAAPFAHCPSASWFPGCPPAARFASCPAAARFRYCLPEGRLLSLLSPRRPLRLCIHKDRETDRQTDRLADTATSTITTNTTNTLPPTASSGCGGVFDTRPSISLPTSSTLCGITSVSIVMHCYLFCEAGSARRTHSRIAAAVAGADSGCKTKAMQNNAVVLQRLGQCLGASISDVVVAHLQRPARAALRK